MKTLAWLISIGAVAGIGFYFWRLRNAWVERQRAAEERYSSMLVSAQVPGGAPAAPAAAPAAATSPAMDVAVLQTQKLLFDAAAKAGEAGEPVLAIQLYAKLLSRFPQSGLAAQARAAVEALKKKIPQSH